MKPEPTPEQLEAVARAMFGNIAVYYKQHAAAAWNIIAPMVRAEALEEAAAACELVADAEADGSVPGDFSGTGAAAKCADLIRALKNEP